MNGHGTLLAEYPLHLRNLLLAGFEGSIKSGDICGRCEIEKALLGRRGFKGRETTIRQSDDNGKNGSLGKSVKNVRYSIT